MVVLLDKNNSIGFVTILGQIDPLETGYMPLFAAETPIRAGVVPCMRLRRQLFYGRRLVVKWALSGNANRRSSNTMDS